MIDHTRRQLAIIEKEYLKLFAEGVSQEGWCMGCNARRFPVGARYFYALQAVYTPGSMSKEKAS